VTTILRSSTLRFAFVMAVAMILLAVSQNVASVRAASPVFVHPTDATCGGMGTAGTDCFSTIQQAVDNAGPAPAQVFVFPGTYSESLDLSNMGDAIGGSPGDISLMTVDATGAPAAGTATISSPNGPALFNSQGPFPGTIRIEGFNVTSADEDGIDLEGGGDAFIVGVTADGNNGIALDGLDIDVTGSATVSGSVALGNSLDGINVNAGGNVTISDSEASANGDDGFAATGINVTITNSSAIINAFDGFQFGDVEGNVVADRLTAIGNGVEGIGIESQGVGDIDSITVQNSWIEGNDEGIRLADLAPLGTFHANGNVICGNVLQGMQLSSDATVDAEANWWGDASGPAPIGIGDLVVDGGNGGSGIVDSTPWIDTITSSADPATVGGSSPVTFQFSGGVGFLGQGPGDPNGPTPFVLTTSNGTLTTPTESGITVPMSLNAPNGTVEVVLTPQAEGPATVTLTGPCGLNSSIVLDVGPMLPAPVAGDVNGDGATTIADALLVAQCVAGLTGPCADASDVNGDGAETIADALLIAQFVAGLIPSL
jgi:hypothetical protein